MKGIILYMFFGVLFFACEPIDSRLPYEKNIDPATDPSGFSRALRIDGSNESGNLPLNPSNSLSINQAQKEATVSKGSTLYIPFTFISQSPIVGIFLQVVGADNFWKIPAQKVQTASGTYIFSINIPKNILNGSASITYAAYDANGKTTNSIEMNTEITSTETVCVAGEPFRKSGSRGLYQKTLLLGNKAGVVTISYNMYTLPDRLDIRYNGKWVASTAVRVGPPTKSQACFDGQEGYVPGTGTLKVEYDPAINKEIEIYMTGCEGDTRWDLSVNCPDNACSCEKIDLASQTKTFEMPANSDGIKSSDVTVKAGDFVFFGVKNTINVDNRYLTFSNANGVNKIMDITRSIDDFRNQPSLSKKYKKFNFGQLILRLGSKEYGAESYKFISSLKGDCAPTEIGMKLIMFGEYGAYFKAEQDGILKFEINDSNPSNNSGSFAIQIVTMSRKQHEERNYCNTCPSTVPIKKNGVYLDNIGNEWDFGYLENYSGAVECFHGGNDSFRGSEKNAIVKNSQCVYDKQGKLVNNINTMGTYDFEKSGTRQHIIMDVFTHEALGSQYKPTCKIY